ncbi:hypothetical protein ABZ553_42535 [Streptomyces sparsogenes]
MTDGPPAGSPVAWHRHPAPDTFLSGLVVSRPTGHTPRTAP